MGFVRIFDGETSFQHLLGKGCPQGVRSAVSSKCISLSVLDERAKPTASSTGCWDENDRFAVVQVVWEARAAGDDADTSEVHIGFLDIDEHLSVTDEDRYLCFPPDESDAKYDIMYFGIYSLGAVGATPLDVRVNPASVTDFRMRPTSLMGCRTLDKDGGVLSDARQKLPRVTTASFEVAYLSAQESTLARFDSSQQRILASLSQADATHLSQPATLFERCAMSELIPDQGFVVHDQVCLIRPDGHGSLPTADDVGAVQGFGSFEFALSAMIDDLDARIKEQEDQDGEGEPYELLERRAELYGERKKMKKRLKSGKFEYYVEVSRERRQANVPETYWYKASSLKLFDQGHDAVRQRRVLMNLAVETNRPQLILNFFQQAANGGDRATVLKWATDTFEKLERKAKGRLPEDGQGNDHDFGRMCVLDTLRTIYSYVQQADAEATLGSLSNLERMRRKIEAEWSRSRLTDWLFATHMLPQKKDTIKGLLPQLGAQYANLRASRGSRQSYPKPGDPVLLVDALMPAGEAAYPPRTLKGFLTADAGRMSGTEKSYLFYYFLLDYDAHTGDFKAEEFARLFDLPVSATRTLATFRHLDNEVFTPDGNDFTEFMLADATVIKDQDVLVLRALYDLKYIETSLEFVQIKQPNFGEKQDVLLCANILITNKRINDAFFYIRNTGKDSDIHADLVEHFCTRALEQKQIGQVIRLPLSQEEEEVLLEVLQGSDRPTAKEALVLYLVHRARYVEAFRTHRQYMESAPELGETDKNRHEDLKKLLDGYFKLLPRVQRKLARSDRDLAGPGGGGPAFNVPMTPRTKGPSAFSTAHIVQNAFLRPAAESMMDESGDTGALDTTTFAGPPVTPTRLRNNKYSLQFATPTAAARPSFGTSFGMGPMQTPESEMEMESPVVASPKAVKQQVRAPSSILKRPKSGKKRGGIRFGPDVAEETEDEKVEINPDSSCEDITFNIAPRDLEAINALSPVDDSPSVRMDDSSSELTGPQVLFGEPADVMESEPASAASTPGTIAANQNAMESEPVPASSTPGAIAASQPARGHGGALRTPPRRTRTNVVALAAQFAPSPLVQASYAMEFTLADEDDGAAAAAPPVMMASTPRARFGDQQSVPGSAAASPVGWGSSTPTPRETKVSQFQPSPSPMGGGGGGGGGMMVPRLTKVSQFAPASPARSNLRTSVTASQFAQAGSPQVFGSPAVQANVSALSGGGSQSGTPKRPEKVKLTPTAQSPRSQFVAHDSPLAAPSPLARTVSGASSASSASTVPVDFSVVNSPRVSAAPTPMQQDDDFGHAAATPATPMEDAAAADADSPAPDSPEFVAPPPARRTRTPAAAKVKARRTKSAALPGHGQSLPTRRSSRLRTRKTK